MKNNNGTPIVTQGASVRQPFAVPLVKNNALTPDSLIKAAEQEEAKGNPMLATDLLGAAKKLRERTEMSAWTEGGAA